MASYYFRNTGSTAWNLASNWSLTDGGGATGAVPTSSDDAFFTSNSGNCVLNAGGLLCKTLIFSGVGAGNYSGAFTVTNAITVYGNVTLSSTMTITGTNTLTVNTTGTLTSNGETWTGALVFTGTSQTYTMGDNWTVNGTTTFNATVACTVNSNQITCAGGLISATTTVAISGSVTLIISGGVLNGANNSGGWSINVTINSSGTVTPNTAWTQSGGTFTYTAGTFVPSGHTLYIGGNVILDTNGITWNAISSTLTSTFTLSSLLTCNGNFLLGANVTHTFAGTAGFTVGSITSSNINHITILVSGVTYTINNSFTFTATAGNHNIFKSSTGGVNAILTLKQGATQDLSFIDGTDIDSSNGQTIWSYKGTLTRTTNWNLINPDGPRTAATTF